MIKKIFAMALALTTAITSQANIVADGIGDDWAAVPLIADTGIDWLSGVSFSQDSYGVYMLFQTAELLADNSFAFFMDVD